MYRNRTFRDDKQQFFQPDVAIVIIFERASDPIATGYNYKDECFEKRLEIFIERCIDEDVRRVESHRLFFLDWLLNEHLLHGATHLDARRSIDLYLLINDGHT